MSMSNILGSPQIRASLGLSTALPCTSPRWRFAEDKGTRVRAAHRFENVTRRERKTLVWRLANLNEPKEGCWDIMENC